MKKIIDRINWGLLKKNLKLKEKIKTLELDKQNLAKEKLELYDLINVQQAQYHELDVLLRKIKTLLGKSALFRQLVEVFDKK